MTAVLRTRLRIAEYDDAGAGLWTERGSLVSGNATAGTISTTIPVTQDDYVFSIGIIGVSAAIITPPASYSICNNGAIATIPLSLSGTAPWVLEYRTTGTTTTNFSQSLSTPEINLTGSDIGGYSATPYTLSLVSVKDATNTTGTVAPTQVQVTVLQTYVPSITGATSVGTGETRTYSTTSHAGSSYAWSWVSAPAGASIATPTAASTNITFGSATIGTFQLQVTETSVAPASCSVTSVISITISNTPTPSITPTTENICIGSEIVYSTPNNTGNSYMWTVTNGTCVGSCGTYATGAAAATMTVRWNVGSGPGSISVTERTASMITGNATNTYQISTMPVNKTLLENAICDGQNGNITVVSSEANISYQLYRYDDNTTVGTAVSGIAATNINLPTGILTTSTNYYVTAYNEGCSLRIPASGYVTETVNPIPVPAFTGPNSICAGDAGIYQTAAGMADYTWTILPAGSGTISGVSDA